jgi:ankyrin repeat protein
MRDLKFHQQSSGTCSWIGGWIETLTYDEDDSWVTEKFEEDRQKDRQNFINGLRRWELLQLDWYLSSISQLLAKAEQWMRRHNTDGARSSRHRARRGESILKIKSCHVSPHPNLFLTVRSEIPYGNHDSFDVAALFGNASLKDPFKSIWKAKGTNGARSIIDPVSSPISPIRPVEYGFIEACAAGDITHATSLLTFAREHSNFEVIRHASHSAIAAGHYKIMKLFLTRTELDLRGPFQDCIKAWHRNIRQACFKHRNIGSLYKALLDILFDLSSTQIAKILLRSCDESVAEILRACRKRNDSPLVLCARHGKLEAVEFLLDIGVPVDWYQSSSGETALHAASIAGDEAITRQLLESGARINEPDAAGQTALMRAVEYGHQEIVRLLLSQGANMEPKCSLPASICPQLLLDAGVHIDLRTDAEESLLIHACRQRDVSADMVQMLLQAGGKIRAIDTQGKTALHWACIHDRVDIARLLFQAGASSGARDGSGATPLLLASKQSSPGLQSNLLAYLIRRGADVNARDDISWTPLMWAAYSGKVNEVDILLRSGADVDAVTEECDSERVDIMTSSSTLARCRRYSALSLAALIADSKVQNEVIKLLFQYGADVGLARRLLQN